ncbi:MAG: Gfo/Idh/MocA family oxidoreductase [Chitinivibrionales bacterium]|nr:Gfo/Idh/MocA family oxidoreductase [Chitinivibrionales bacterium]
MNKKNEKKLRVGVIGLSMGQFHIQGYQQHKNAVVAAIADLDKSKLETVGDKYAVPGRYTDYKKMLAREDLDIVSVVTPNIFHKPIAIAALKAGCHVLCEKPMAMNAGQAREMLAAANAAKKRIMINFSYRFNEQSQALKRAVEAGVMGDIYFGRTVWHRRRGIPGLGGWFCSKKMAGGGPLIDLGVHRLDLALWLMGYPKPAAVIGNTFNSIGRRLAAEQGKPFDVEDLATGYITFTNGAVLTVEASWASNIGDPEIMETRLLGTKAGLLQRNLNGGYTFECEIYSDEQGFLYNKKLNSAGPVFGPMYHFVDAITHDKPHIADGKEGLIVMEILDALYKSAKTGRQVTIG